MKEPAYMYYPSDWRSSPAFGCTIAARGLWREMMDMMFASEHYGYLTMNGQPTPDDVIARYCGVTLEDYLTLLAELLVHGVPRKTSNGVLYSHRMVKDYKERCKWRNDKRQQRLRENNKNVHHIVHQLSGPSPPSSPPVSQKKRQKKEAATEVACDLPAALSVPIEIWKAFVDMRRKKKKDLTPYAVDLIITKLHVAQTHGHSPREMLDRAIENHWTTVYEPNSTAERKSYGKRPDYTESDRELAEFARGSRRVAAGVGEDLP